MSVDAYESDRMQVYIAYTEDTLTGQEPSAATLWQATNLLPSLHH